MDSETIIFLLKGGHLNMDERVAKNIWPHPPLKLNDLINEVIRYLKTEKFFPHPWVQRKDGEFIDDVCVIEKINPFIFIFRSRAASPSDLTRITAQGKKVFFSARSVVKYYLRWALNLPGDLDGWKVIKG